MFVKNKMLIASFILLLNINAKDTFFELKDKIESAESDNNAVSPVVINTCVPNGFAEACKMAWHKLSIELLLWMLWSMGAIGAKSFSHLVTTHVDAMDQQDLEGHLIRMAKLH